MCFSNINLKNRAYLFCVPHSFHTQIFPHANSKLTLSISIFQACSDFVSSKLYPISSHSIWLVKLQFQPFYVFSVLIRIPSKSTSRSYCENRRNNISNKHLNQKIHIESQNVDNKKQINGEKNCFAKAQTFYCYFLNLTSKLQNSNVFNLGRQTNNCNEKFGNYLRFVRYFNQNLNTNMWSYITCVICTQLKWKC